MSRHVPLSEQSDADLERALDAIAEVYRSYTAELERRRENREFRAETERRRRGQQRPNLRLVTT